MKHLYPLNMFKLIRNTFTVNQSTDIKSIPSRFFFYQEIIFFLKLKKNPEEMKIMISESKLEFSWFIFLFYIR